jgi:ABC-2 type transport system ATP-binding protein
MNLASVTFGYRRRGRPVLDDLTWAVPAGRTVLLGPNGAGKSTLLGVAAGVLLPRRGHVEVSGLQFGPSRRRVRDYSRGVGWMPQTVRPIPGLRVVEQVAYAGWLRGLGRAEASERALEALKLVDLADKRDTPVHQVSGGQLRRVGLASAVVHRPPQLLLDEPTAGLDPAQRERFRALLDSVLVGCDVVVSTHQVDDLSESYDHVAVLVDGQIRFVDTVAAFLAVADDDEPRRAEVAYRRVTAGATVGDGS